MSRSTLTLALIVSIFSSLKAAAQGVSYPVKESDIHSGYIVQKIWLEHYELPEVSISDVAFAPDAKLPDGVLPAAPASLTVGIGMERKRPFAVVRIPAYSVGVAGAVNRVSAYSLTVAEKNVTGLSYAARPTAAANSVLANGTWYKIAVTKTGFYKLDNTFLASLGVTTSSINPANIRIYGNGGKMLSENNAVGRADDLQENAIWVNDGGDNSFGSSDFVVFYATGPLAWDKDSVNQRFSHHVNLYADTAYYFITFDQGTGLRVGTEGAPGSANKTVTDFNYYDVHDVDLVNPAGLGKLWYGELFSPLAGNTTQSFNFDMGTAVSSVHGRVSLACTQPASGSQFSVAVNGVTKASSVFTVVTSESNVMGLLENSWDAAVNAQNVRVDLAFGASAQSALGYLNYIELNARRALTITGDQLNFRDWQSVGAGNIAGYQLQGANGNTKVWDVTNPQVPVQMSGSLSGSTYTFTRDAQRLHEFAAMNSTSLFTPKFIGKVPNQNLHGSGQVDMIIVTNSKFADQANELAEYHKQHDNMRVIVATNEQIYNEFSSGGQDLSAIRDFTRMFYKRAGSDEAQMPKYLLLFGGASYDYKDRLSGNTNFVPVFESSEVQNSISGFSTDDFYGFLDDNENIEDINQLNALDIAVGRLPARSVSDASILVKKIKSYKAPATLGPWRISTTIVGDNGFTAKASPPGYEPDAAGDHMLDAEDMARMVDKRAEGLYNQSKIYLDAIPIITTPAGPRCPGANAAINDRMFKGTFMVNYNGHGNPQVWAHERILTQDDFNKWNNKNMLPFMVTATCDFGQFDHPQYVSAAEQLALRNDGGVITVLTTTAAVFANYNNEINQQYLDAQYTRRADGKWNTFGEACRIGKNITYLTSKSSGQLANFYKFALLGDPALVPDFPEYDVHIDAVKDGITLAPADTIKALGKYTIDGSVHDIAGSMLTGFNGILWLSLYDKPRSVVTITGHEDVYKVQDNIVYRGKVTVTNGRFSVTFIAPKDINYAFGTAKISTYTHNNSTDAAGKDTSITVGGFSENPQLSDAPPIVRPYINDSLFLNGGITGANTSLFVSLYSETGINVSGNNLGHDLIAILDDNVEQPYILNDYYETAANTYQRGFVLFPVNGLANGKHTIRVKAWDVNNNSGEGTVDFIVVDGQVVDIQSLGNYPNPFANSTHFIFEHNHPLEALTAKINIYNSAGSLVRSLEENFTPSGSRSNEITWDGTDKGGSRLPSGLYLYKLEIATEKGFRSVAYQKLVIVR
ncbi:MAG: type IX secretion system sortase PorU [Bacteroidota bacterium]